MRRITDRQKLFVAEYALEQNASRAAVLAGYSKKTARHIGAENLTKPYIKEMIAVRMSQRSSELARNAAERMVTKERWLEEIEKIAFSNLADYMKIDDSSGQPRLKVQVTPEFANGAVRKISETANGISLELHDKVAALALLGKAYGWLQQKDRSMTYNSASVVLYDVNASTVRSD